VGFDLFAGEATDFVFQDDGERGHLGVCGQI
jgi:hypothetical protein